MPDLSLSRAMWIDGWMTPLELRWLAEQAQRHTTIVEVGCFVGRSTTALAQNTAGVVYAVDPWPDHWHPEDLDDDVAWEFSRRYPHPLQTFSSNMAAEKNVFIYRGTIEGLPHVRPDMVFIDGDHHYGAVASDIDNALRQLKTPARRKPVLLCGHDYDRPRWPDVTQAVRDVLGTPNVYESIWWREL